MKFAPFARRAFASAAIIAAAAAFAPTVSSALAASQPSSKVAVIPGFAAPVYAGTFGIPTFPASAPELSHYSFTPVGLSSVTTSELQQYDTIVLYGLRWNTLSGSAQSAINAFSKTGKVVIWDSDSTGAQSYSTFVHPFSTRASGESGSKSGAVVTFPAGSNPLASSDPASPLFLDPSALVASTHIIGHMSVMQPGAADWAPALIAQNPSIPTGGWVVAWGYGDTAAHTGMVVYSGVDADAFTDTAKPNYAIKELRLEFAASFSRSVDAGCAPNCGPPVSDGGGNGNGGTTFAQCSLLRAAPKSWVRGAVTLSVKSSAAAGLKVSALTSGGRLLATGIATKPGRYAVRVNTRRLPSNKQSRISIVVDVNGARACMLPVLLKVDNVPPRLSRVSAQRVLTGLDVTFRVSEKATVTIVSGSRVRHMTVAAGKTIRLTLGGGTTRVRVTARDRAGNTTVRRVSVKS